MIVPLFGLLVLMAAAGFGLLKAMPSHLSDTHHDALQDAEPDLQARAQAVKLLEQTAL
jgi:hypothetical protein